MRFSVVQKRIFGTLDGAYSIVTARENYDSQITLTDFEAELVTNFFGDENIHTGNVKQNPNASSKSFRLYPVGELVDLNLVYPKPGRLELRLYISARGGFKPDGGEVWFVYCKDGDIWIGSMSELQWRISCSGLKQDESDDIYQRVVNEDDPGQLITLKERDVYKRDRRFASMRLKMAEYKCEVDGTHKLFESRFSRRPYLEAHHLIPLALQSEFKQPLDFIDNIFCLCPYCHRAVHNAEETVAREIIETLSSVRPVNKYYDLTVSDLYVLYSIENIE